MARVLFLTGIVSVLLGIQAGARTLSDSTAKQAESSTTIVRVDASFPWSDCDQNGAIQKLRRDPQNAKRLLVDLRLNPATNKAMICLSLAEVAELASRPPVGLAAPFSVTLNVPPQFVGKRSSPNGWALWYKDSLSRWHESPGSWQNIDSAGNHTIALPPVQASDLTEIGLYIGLGPGNFEYTGPVTVSVDQLWFRRSKPPEHVGPEEGETVMTLDSPSLWRPGSSFKGIAAVEAGKDGSIILKCDLDSLDRTKRSGVAVARLDQIPDLKPPLDMTTLGLFLSVKAPKEFVAKGKFSSGVHAGLIDAANVFWSRWETVTEADRWVTAAIYPQTDYPLPFTFRSADFDPTRIAAVAVRLTVDQADPLRFQGEISLKNVRIVRLPEELRVERQRVTSALRPLMGESSPSRRELSRAPAPLETFIQNLGVNYPWPFETYPGIGVRSWDPTQGGFSSKLQQIRRDFRYLESVSVRLVRVFIAGDCRTGVLERNGTIRLDHFALRDIDGLLRVFEEHPKLRLVPVIFDFTMADQETRERMVRVGEHPDWIKEETLRKRLLDAVEPILTKLATHPQVAFIDLFNEPEHIKAVSPDAYVSFIQDMAERIRKLNPAMKVTVGSRTSVDASFWQLPVRDWLPTFHWFDKIEIDKLPLGYAPSSIDRNVAIVTEVDPTVGVSYALDTLWKEGFGGALFWSLNANDGMPFRGKPAEELRSWVATHSQLRK